MSTSKMTTREEQLARAKATDAAMVPLLLAIEPDEYTKALSARLDAERVASEAKDAAARAHGVAFQARMRAERDEVYAAAGVPGAAERAKVSAAALSAAEAAHDRAKALADTAAAAAAAAREG